MYDDIDKQHRTTPSFAALASKLLLALLLLTASCLLYTSAPSASAAEGSNVFIDTEGHWGAAIIRLAVSDGLANGYDDRTFRPDRPVTEAEYLALLLRAYNVIGKEDEGSSSWAAPYYDYALGRGWPLAFSNEAGSFRRGDAARLTAVAASGLPLGETEAIEWLLGQGIASGRTSPTVKGFVPDGLLTRAEALSLIYKLKNNKSALNADSISLKDTALRGVSLHDHADKLLYLLGEPSRKDASEYGYTWHVYNDDYSKFAMFGISGKRVVAMFSNITGIWSGELPSLPKGTLTNHYYILDGNEVQTTLFIDTYKKDKLSGILLQDRQALTSKKASLGTTEREAFEQQLFDFANAERALQGISLFKQDTLAAKAARAHSEDMKVNQFFNHQNKKGQSPFDRMKAQGIDYLYASENIAAGPANSLFAHYVLLNSAGHRKALLNPDLERLGTGIAFGGKYKFYYTQSFYTPMQ